jgi:Na+-transporting NADH:ubiquinone oxidoreductase subunit B
MGETSALLILVALGYLLFRGVVAKPLVFGLVIGAVVGKLFLKAVGVDVMPLGQGLAISFLGGGTLFLMTFMVTEPVTAPTKTPARWVYAGLVGFLGMIIRTMSAFNAGFMFALLLGNMFAPILDIAWTEFAAWRTRAREASAPAVAGEGGS